MRLKKSMLSTHLDDDDDKLDIKVHSISDNIFIHISSFQFFECFPRFQW